ncbi:protein Mpv17 isoform X2 [Procambarus clarkii]|uniref:protein Mpv17 isoform X2 n=1 Tax=Procambarus clarkii TaxID=6728 RepID=UPI001E677A5E|nr:protein Mpv17-like isoform X2 [Procambarus clarkii]
MCTLTGAGDLLSQFFVEKKPATQYEWQRTARFFAIGTFFIGPSITKWYRVLDVKFGSGKGIRALKKVAVDQLVFAPVFLGVFLGVLGVMQGHRPQRIQNDIKKNYKDIILTCWSVWPAVQICNFSFVPLNYQVLVAQTFALVWNTYLAWKTNKDTVVPEPQEKLTINK